MVWFIRWWCRLDGILSITTSINQWWALHILANMYHQVSDLSSTISMLSNEDCELNYVVIHTLWTRSDEIRILFDVNCFLGNSYSSQLQPRFVRKSAYRLHCWLSQTRNELRQRWCSDKSDKERYFRRWKVAWWQRVTKAEAPRVLQSKDRKNLKLLLRRLIKNNNKQLPTSSKRTFLKCGFA